MRHLVIATIILAGTAGVTNAQAKIYHTTRTLSGTVEPGHIAVVGPFASIDKYCKSTATAAIKIVQRPKYGTLKLSIGSGEIEMKPGSRLAMCNDLRARGSIVTYSPRDNFHGTDVFRILLSFEDGERRLVTVPLTIQ